MEPAFPRGIEVLVKKAAVDPEFRRLLLAKRAEAAARIGLKLDPAEVCMLAGVPAAQLESTITRTKVSERQRPIFLGTAAALILAALGTAQAATEPPPPGGISPDRPLSEIQAALKEALREHQDAKKNKDADRLLMTSWLQRGKLMRAVVSLKGERETNNAGVAERKTALAKEELDKILAALKTLPAEKVATRPDNALIVSWRDGDEWKTRQYDRAELPKELVGLFALIGAPLDSAARPDVPVTRGITHDRP
jgi:hypothetical protein